MENVENLREIGEKFERNYWKKIYKIIRSILKTFRMLKRELEEILENFSEIFRKCLVAFLSKYRVKFEKFRENMEEE